MASPYYDVVMIPTLDNHCHEDEIDPSMEDSEWPPSRCKMYVFSSKLGYWEEKYFVREGDPAGTVRQMREGFVQSKPVYFQRAIYVHCRSNFLMRVSLSNNMYRVIKPPKDATEERCDYQVVRSKKGVYFVSLDKYWPWYKCWLRVWILDESCGRTEWMLKLDKDLKPLLARHRLNKRFKWILEDINYNLFLSSVYPEGNKKPTGEESVEWNSDDDVEEEEDMVDHYLLQDNMKSVVKKEFKWNSNDHRFSSDEERYFLGEERYIHSYSDVEILGFHPYKEIIFLSASERTGLAYHLNESKIEELGNIYPKEYGQFKQVSNEQEKIKSFPYTPCWIEEFPG
nr:uncharacterized protein LOC127304546 [Lolium perenne]